MSDHDSNPIQWRDLLRAWLLILWIPCLYDTSVYQVRLAFSESATPPLSAATWLGYVPACIILPIAAHLLSRRRCVGLYLALAGLMLLAGALAMEFLSGLHSALTLYRTAAVTSYIGVIRFSGCYLPRIILVGVTAVCLLQQMGELKLNESVRQDHE